MKAPAQKQGEAWACIGEYSQIHAYPSRIREIGRCFSIAAKGPAWVLRGEPRL